METGLKEEGKKKANSDRKIKRAPALNPPELIKNQGDPREKDIKKS